MQYRSDSTMNKPYLIRLYYLISVFIILFILLIARVVFLTFFNRVNQESRQETRVQRGVIYDRRGIELALSQDSSTIGINPSNIYDPEFTSAQLAPLLKIPKEKIAASINEKSNYFLLKREVDNKTAKKIVEMGLPGVRQEKEFKRVYPNGNLASNLIGFTGMDDNKSLSGLELIYHQELMTPSSIESNRGSDLHLTIDSLIQYKLESALGKAFVETKSKKAVGIFMDVHTGKILAMASFPNFNPNRYNDYPAESTTNWAIRHVYEPGSTMKIFMAAILYNEGHGNPKNTYHCPGYIEFGNSIIRCTDKHGHVNLEEILQYSCNVGIIRAIKKIPDDKLYEYMRNLYFGQKTGFSQYENRGYMPEHRKWNPSTSTFLSIGQGISVTPIQLLTSAAAIINGGKIFTPIVVSGITTPYGEIIKQFNVKHSAIGINEKAVKQLMKAMVKVVQSGTGKNAYLQDYAIAGKTGTGQKAKPGLGYTDNSYSASFLGFFPASNPRIAGLILFDEPGGIVHTGGGLAAPVFRQVVENIIPIIETSDVATSYSLKRIQTNRSSIDPHKMPDFTSMSVRESIKILTALKKEYSISGSGFCYKQEPGEGADLRQEIKIKLFFK